MTEIIINLKANEVKPISQTSLIKAFSILVDLDSLYVYMGNEDVSESNYWQKIPGGGEIVSGETDLAEVYLFSPTNSKVTITY